MWRWEIVKAKRSIALVDDSKIPSEIIILDLFVAFHILRKA